MRSATALLAALLLSLSVAEPCAAQLRRLDVGPGDTLIVKTNRGKLRERPSAAGKVIGSLWQGDTLVVRLDSTRSSRRDDYYAVTAFHDGLPYDGEKGFVFVLGIESLADSRERLEAERRREAEERRREEEEARRRAARVAELRRAGFSIELLMASHETDRIGSVTWSVVFSNISETKRIKYITFTVEAFNAVGDPTGGRRAAEQKLKGIGPVEPGRLGTYAFEDVWYDETVQCVELKRVDVEHFDGSRFVYINDLRRVGNEYTLQLPGSCQDV